MLLSLSPKLSNLRNKTSPFSPDISFRFTHSSKPTRTLIHRNSTTAARHFSGLEPNWPPNTWGSAALGEKSSIPDTISCLWQSISENSLMIIPDLPFRIYSYHHQTQTHQKTKSVKNQKPHPTFIPTQTDPTNSSMTRIKKDRDLAPISSSCSGIEYPKKSTRHWLQHRKSPPLATINLSLIDLLSSQAELDDTVRKLCSSCP